MAYCYNVRALDLYIASMQVLVTESGVGGVGRVAGKERETNETILEPLRIHRHRILANISTHECYSLC